MYKVIKNETDMNKCQATHLINFSGGFDSVYYLSQVLKKTEHKLLLHHCVYSKNREPAESTACSNILNYFSDYHDRISYIETGYDKTGVHGKILDILPIHAVTGIMLTNGYPQLKYIYKSTSFDDIRGKTDLVQWLQSGKKYNDFKGTCRWGVIKDVVKLLSGRNFIWKIPYWKMTKHDMILDMPKELVELVHYCRQKKGVKQPCETCHACRWSRAGRAHHGLVKD